MGEERVDERCEVATLGRRSAHRPLRLVVASDQPLHGRCRRGRGPRTGTSGASRSKNSSSVSSTTSAIRASGRSTLLMIGTTGRSDFEGFAQHEAGLGTRAFGGVDEQHRAVDHREGAFDLAAEVGVAGGVDDVQAALAEAEGGLLGEDGDALLPLEVHRVEDPVDDFVAIVEACRPGAASRRRASSCRGRRGR